MSLMLSYNGKRPYLGTNPYCFAAPCKDEPPFCLDMATTNISFNQVKKHREDSIPIPGGFAADKSGKETFDANQAASLFPIGRYKGFGLSMMIEVLCSQLSGMPYGRSIVPMFTAPLEEEIILPYGMPVAQIIPFKREEWTLTTNTIEMDAPEFNHHMNVIYEMSTHREGGYKKQHGGPVVFK